MQRDQLLELRSKIVESAQQLALNGQGTAEDRLQVLLNVIRSGDASLEVLSRAYELANGIENDDDKLTALLDVLYEVDADLAKSEQSDAPVEQQADNQENYHTE